MTENLALNYDLQWFPKAINKINIKLTDFEVVVRIVTFYIFADDFFGLVFKISGIIQTGVIRDQFIVTITNFIYPFLICKVGRIHVFDHNSLFINVLKMCACRINSVYEELRAFNNKIKNFEEALPIVPLETTYLLLIVSHYASLQIQSSPKNLP